jgi:sporulation protein YlmC with PRC-barrel domain
MRASELLGRRVLDGDGREVGIVHDVVVRLGDDGRVSVSGLVVAPATVRARLAHAWGYAQGRARGPAVLRSWVMAGTPSEVVPAARVRSWDEASSVVLRAGAGS